MRLLFSLTYFTPYSSGLTLYVKRLGEELAKRGYKISVLCFQHQEGLKTQENINNVKVTRVKPLLKVSKGFFSFDWLVKSWQEVRGNDVIIISLPQFEGVWPALFGRIFGKKVISVYHCEVDLPQGGANYLIERLLNLSHIVTLSLSGTVVTYTRDFAKHSKILTHFSHKLRFIYPPILVPKADKRVQKVITEKSGGKKGFFIGVAARLAAEKGIEYLFEAILLLKDKFQIPNSKFQILIAGSLEPVGEERYKRKILDLVEKYKDYVVFLGELKEEEMGSFYSLIDILVLPSVNSTEAFGMVQVEAMTTGVPVVTTNLPGVRIPIQKTGMGLIVPIKNSQKLAEAIAEILLNHGKYIKNKEFIKKEFSIEKTIEFYDKLIKKPT